MTEAELKAAVHAVVEDYSDRIHKLGTANDILPPDTRHVRADPRTHDRAEQYWQDFLDNQIALNQQYAADNKGA